MSRINLFLSVISRIYWHITVFSDIVTSLENSASFVWVFKAHIYIFLFYYLSFKNILHLIHCVCIYKFSILILSRYKDSICTITSFYPSSLVFGRVCIIMALRVLVLHLSTSSFSHSLSTFCLTTLLFPFFLSEYFSHHTLKILPRPTQLSARYHFLSLSLSFFSFIYIIFSTLFIYSYLFCSQKTGCS